MPQQINTDPRHQKRGFDIDAWNERVASGEFEAQPEPDVFMQPSIYQVAQNAVARAVAVAEVLENGRFLKGSLAEYSD